MPLALKPSRWDGQQHSSKIGLFLCRRWISHCGDFLLPNYTADLLAKNVIYIGPWPWSTPGSSRTSAPELFCPTCCLPGVLHIHLKSHSKVDMPTDTSYFVNIRNTGIMSWFFSLFFCLFLLVSTKKQFCHFHCNSVHFGTKGKVTLTEIFTPIL